VALRLLASITLLLFALLETTVMQLLYPLSLWWLTLAGPLVMLFLLKVKPRRQSVSTLLFWQEVIPDSRPRRWWQRLRDPMFLALQLLLLLLLVLAVAEPQAIGWGQRPRRIVLILDNSASMNAATSHATRWSRALVTGARIIDRLRPADQMAILTTAPTPQVQIGFTSHPPSLHRQLESLVATEAPARLHSTIQLAARLLGGDDQAELWVVTDPAGRAQAQDDAISGATPDPKTASENAPAATESDDANSTSVPSNPNPNPIPVPDSSVVTPRWIVVGESMPNVAITQFQARRQRHDPGEVELLMEVSNLGAQHIDTQLTLQRNGELLDVIPLRVEANGSWRVSRQYLIEAGGELVATLDDSDALACDNQAWAVLAPRKPVRVTLVSPGSVYLQRVLAALPRVVVEVVTALPSSGPVESLLIVHRTALRELPEGRSLVIDLREPNVLGDLSPPGDASTVLPPEMESALLRNVRWDNVTLEGVRGVTWRVEAEPLLQTLTGEPVLTHLRHARGETLVLNLSLEISDLAWRTAFPLLMSNLIQWLANDLPDERMGLAAGTTARLSHVIGAEHAARIASQRAIWQWTAPGGSLVPVSVLDNDVLVGPLEQVGIWTLKRVDAEDGESAPGNAGASRVQEEFRIACNLVSHQESDLRADAASSDMQVAFYGGRPPWFWLTLGALMMLSVEWWLYQRRFIG
jgi:hypothetical protein